MHSNVAGGTDGLHSFKIYHAVVGRIALNMVVCAGSGGLLAIGIAGFVQAKTEFIESILSPCLNRFLLFR